MKRPTRIPVKSAFTKNTHLIALACLGLLASCKTTPEPSNAVAQPQVLHHLRASFDGYSKDASGVWRVAILLTNTGETPVRAIVGSWPAGTPDIPMGTRGGPAVNLRKGKLPKTLRWREEKPGMSIFMMMRYGLLHSRTLTAHQSKRILLPLYTTPSYPGETHNQIIIAFPKEPPVKNPQGYDSYIAEVVL